MASGFPHLPAPLIVIVIVVVVIVVVFAACSEPGGQPSVLCGVCFTESWRYPYSTQKMVWSDPTSAKSPPMIANNAL